VQIYSGLVDRLYEAPGEWSLSRCANAACGLVWLDPMPLAEDLPMAYRAYFTHAPSSAPASPSPSPLKLRLRAARRGVLAALGAERERMRLACMDLEQEPPGRLLELGSGDGSRLVLMRTRGWSVEGQDVDAKASAFRLRAEGIPVHHGALESLALPGSSYDAVVMNHVLEHVAEPIAVMRECARLLKPGGSLVSVTPNMRSLGARIFGRSWLGLEPPRHLHLFNRENLTRLAELSGFGRATIRTSYGNADGFAVGSLSIRATGRFVLERGASTTIQSLAAALFQAFEILAAKFARDAGEECVLRAWR
jgi:SAM-dependent methyltransferase